MRRAALLATVLLAAPLSAQMEISNPGGIRVRDPEGPVEERGACTAEREGIKYASTNAQSIGDCAGDGGSERAACICREGEWISLAAEYRVELLRTGCMDGKVPVAAGGALACGDAPTGPQGPEGPAGPQGPPGEDGGGEAIPKEMRMTYGTLAEIPAGWQLCDGSNGTPDMRNNFGRGAAAGQDAGATGGTATHQHDYDEVIDHAHGLTRFPTASGGSSGFTADTSMTGTPTAVTQTTGAAAGAVATGTTEAGSSLPPYVAVLFICRV